MEGKSSKEAGQPEYCKISHEQLVTCSGTMFELFTWKSTSLIHKGDIEDAVAYHHQAPAKQKKFIHDNVVYISELLQLCSFIADKPYIEELRGLSEERQWRGLTSWILVAKGRELGIALPIDRRIREELKYWKGFLDSIIKFAKCEKQALEKTFENRSLALRIKG
ncbi:uncharacterized protein EAF01_002257 [Botrytis porri]|uniref:uncharacterized protein n=1 Tax=Botrytis porri TaxID=87229 RepID=UPI001900CFCA|nr:uncharacterized protein EAF01_002257 [Botrytis porri]KAF7910748.1 hypothetical protein EAF01_002257 [Botrytis porri]